MKILRDREYKKLMYKLKSSENIIKDYDSLVKNLVDEKKDLIIFLNKCIEYWFEDFLRLGEERDIARQEMILNIKEQNDLAGSL